MRSIWLVRSTALAASLLGLNQAHAEFSLVGVKIGGFVGEVGAPIANVVVTPVLQGVERAGGAAIGAVVDTAKGAVTAVAKAADRIAEGKPIDALLMIQIDFLHGQESAAFGAFQKSPELRVGAQMFVTAYTGSAGTAAFNGWYVTRSTGSFERGLKAAAITGITGALQSGISNSIELNVMEKAAASATVGGIASKASGGTFEEGALSAGLTSLADSAYRAYTKAPIDGRAGSKPVEKVDGVNSAQSVIDACSERRNECFVIRTADDMRQVSYRANNIGRFYNVQDGARSIVQEGSSFMRGVNEVPYMNAMAYGHDVLAVDLNITRVSLLAATIPPSMVYTYYASGSDRDARLLELQEEEARRSQ